MLRELRIENLLLIERAELRFDEGFNVITGETGAGKTVLAHSLDLLMGGRARPQIVRPGAAEAWVEGIFDLPRRPGRRTRSSPRSRSACPKTPMGWSWAGGFRPRAAPAPSSAAARPRPAT